MSKLCKKINLQPGYVCNPQTGHWVKTGGKIGKQILSKYKKEELIFSGAPPEINVPKKTDLTGMDLLKLLNDPSYSSQIDVDIHQSPTRSSLAENDKFVHYKGESDIVDRFMCSHSKGNDC